MEYFPTWLAPNLITLLGLFALIVSYGITAAYLPDFTGPTDRWLYLMAAGSVFFYLHMDALDGKQARRTKTSSPLGQLFDHGCDALAVHLILVTLITSLQYKHEWKAVVGVLYVFIPWWMAHWEEYHTGVMIYGNGAWGVTEANYAVVAVHLYTYILGPRGWTFHLIEYFLHATGIGMHLPKPVYAFLAGLQINDMLLLLFGCFGVTLFLEQANRVFRLAGSKQLDHTTLPPNEQGHKTLGRAHAAWHLVQIITTCGTGSVLLALPLVPPTISRILFATFGVTYAMQATRLIMAHMAKEPFYIAAWPLVLMGIEIANYYARFADPILLAYTVNIVVVAGYLHYVIGIIGEICGYLKIKALTIKPRME